MDLAHCQRFQRAEARRPTCGLVVPVTVGDGVLKLLAFMADLAFSPANGTISRFDDPMVFAGWPTGSSATAVTAVFSTKSF